VWRKGEESTEEEVVDVAKETKGVEARRLRSHGCAKQPEFFRCPCEGTYMRPPFSARLWILPWARATDGATP
jgi:hypothetical protein